MSLRTRILLILLTVIGLYIVLIHGVLVRTVLRSFERLENRLASDNIERCVALLEREIKILDSLCYDWSISGMADRIFTTRQAYFDESKLLGCVFSSNRLNSLYLIRKDGVVAWGKTFDWETNQKISIEQFSGEIDLESPFLIHSKTDPGVSGILRTNSGPMIIASKPVFSLHDNPSFESDYWGTLLIGRFIDEKLIGLIRAESGVALNIYPQKKYALDENRTAIAESVQSHPLISKTGESHIFYVYTLMNDIYGEPSILFKGSVPKQISIQARHTITLALGFIFAGGLLILLVLGFLLNKQVIDPLKLLHNHVSEIIASKDFSKRLVFEDRSEIGKLAGEFDLMMQQLHHQSEENIKSRNKIRDRELCLRRQNQILFDLTKRRKFNQNDLNSAVSQLTEASARTLAVNRVSVWIYNDAGSRISAIDRYENHPGHHSHGEELEIEKYPLFAKGLEEASVMAIDDIAEDLRTKRLAQEYYATTDIRSIIASAVWSEGRIIGIFLCEHCGGTRSWSLDEHNFVSSMADLVAVLFDQFERKKMQGKVRENEAYLKTLLDSVHAGILVVDPVTNAIVDANAYALKLIDHPKDEVVGKYPHVYLATMIETSCPLVLPESSLFVSEGSINAKNGRIPILQSIVLVNRKGYPLLIISFIDLREHKKMEQELIKARKLDSLGVLAGGIAHDFNNLITSILGNISLALLTINEDDEAYNSLKNAEKATLRTRDLNQQLLTFSKGGMPVKKTASIGDLLRDTVRFALRGANITNEFDIPDDLLPVDVDKGQISQVVHNMVINANQAMPNGGTLYISCRNAHINAKRKGIDQKGAFVVISIRDRGVGIPEENLDKIFDPYFTTKQDGSGLGLASCYSIIKNHGGWIDVESKRNEGTTFTIYLPASKNELKQELEESDKPVQGTGRILVVDDEAIIRTTLSDILVHLGYTVECASDGQEAMDLYRASLDAHEPFDVVIMDLTIPAGMGGKETIGELLQIDNNVCAVVSSGYSNDPVMAEYEKYGFKGIIAKPYNVREVSFILHSLLHHS